MTALPAASAKKLGLVIDLDTCVGCHACAVSCKEWNTGGHSAPLTDEAPYGRDPIGVWFNRVHTYEVDDGAASRTVHFPRSCLHCEEPACVTVCPTGASYKREEDGIVLVNAETCIGCKLCSWACPYGARELDEHQRIMKKCTLCVDRIYDDALPENERKPACVMACPTSARLFGDVNDPDSDAAIAIREQGGYQLMPEWGTRPANHYLPRRRTRITIHEDELIRVDNPLKKERQLPMPGSDEPTLDDVTSW
jgi:Fe-S-cluster-containing dehydrogenase component